jgi:transcriptional regulator with PAS, ATPase and Fis domain
LLRVLQERELERVGGNRTLKVDVRVIATTNRRLDESVEKKEFRQDLFFRLNVVPIHIPPLRERLDDVPLLAQEVVRRFSRKHGAQAHGLTPDALRALQAHHWPGNVRELQNVIERAVILCADCALLEPEHLGFAAPQVTRDKGQVAAKVPVSESVTCALPPVTIPISESPQVTSDKSQVAETNASHHPSPVACEDANGFLTMAEVEKRHILAALSRCQGNRTHAAKMLEISIRTMRNKLHEYDGEVERAEMAE